MFNDEEMLNFSEDNKAVWYSLTYRLLVEMWQGWLCKLDEWQVYDTPVLKIFLICSFRLLLEWICVDLYIVDSLDVFLEDRVSDELLDEIYFSEESLMLIIYSKSLKANLYVVSQHELLNWVGLIQTVRETA